MKKLELSDLMSLERYARERKSYRRRMFAHKARRAVRSGDNMSLLFEDRETVLYQIQEMLHAERIFEAEGIQEELDVYNPLIPDGGNWKATMLIEFPDKNMRLVRLRELHGVDRMVWLKVADNEKVFAISDEDLERENEEKTSAVHFLRFELDSASIADAKAGSSISSGCDHPSYMVCGELPEQARAFLAADLD